MKYWPITPLALSDKSCEVFSLIKCSRLILYEHIVGIGVFKNMRLKSITILILIFTFGVGAFGVRNPNIQSPVGRGVVPPSSYRSGLIRSVNPMGIDGNLIVTGNIGGGKHFRGIVPYQSPSSFGVLGTSVSSTSGTLDSFLRRSTFNGGSTE